MSRCAEMLSQEVDVSFIDVNIGCPIDFVFKKVGRLLVSGFFKIFSNLDIFGVSRLRNYSKSVSVTSMPRSTTYFDIKKS